MATTVALGNPDPDSGAGKLAAFQSPSDLEKTQIQLSSLLTCVQALKDFTIHHESSGESSLPGSSVTKKVDADLLAAANKTTIMLLHQIDNIVEDMSRWNLAEGALERAHVELLQANAKLMQLGAEEVALRQRPSGRINPSLVSHGGQWLALLPDSGDPLGSGPSPQAALDDFDKNFLRIYNNAKQRLTKAVRKPRKENPKNEE